MLGGMVQSCRRTWTWQAALHLGMPKARCQCNAMLFVMVVQWENKKIK